MEIVHRLEQDAGIGTSDITGTGIGGSINIGTSTCESA